jgi:hypothetical protein
MFSVGGNISMKHLVLVGLVLALIVAVPVIGGCGGRLTSTGWASVAAVSDHGTMLLHYADGNMKWKRLNPDNVRNDSKMAFKHRAQPARYVETKQGSTLTFPGGDTLRYYEIDPK